MRKIFLTNSTNKVNFYEFPAKKFISLHNNRNMILCVTFRNSVLSNDQNISSESDIYECASEEAYARIVRHAINLGKRGYSHVQVKTVDSDVVILTIAYLISLKSMG